MEFKEYINSESIVIVDFYADWCQPCKILATNLQNFTEFKVLKINVEEEVDIASEYGIRSLPTLLYFKNGEEIFRSVGVMSLNQLDTIAKELKIKHKD